MTNELVQYNVSDGIATITLNRPEVANAQNAELLHRLDALWDDAAADSEVKVILLLLVEMAQRTKTIDRGSAGSLHRRRPAAGVAM